MLMKTDNASVGMDSASMRADSVYLTCGSAFVKIPSSDDIVTCD